MEKEEKKKGTHTDIDVNDAKVYKSNALVLAKYKVNNVLANNILNISLSKIKKDPGAQQASAVLYAAELREILGMEDDSNIYKKLKQISTQIVGNVITIEDVPGEFRTFALITNADYRNQKLEIVFNKEMTPHISALRKSFTKYELSNLLSFSKVSTVRLYEILYKEAYRIKNAKDDFVTVRYGINELRCILGLVDLDAKHISAALSRGATWDDIVEKISTKKDRKYDRFSDFKTHVLNEAQEEIRQKANIRFEYEVEYSRGHKVGSVNFFIYKNNPLAEAKEKAKRAFERVQKAGIGADEIDFDGTIVETYALPGYEEIRGYLLNSGIAADDLLTAASYEQIYHAAQGDINEIKAAIDYSRTVKHIHNLYGWLVEALRTKFYKASPVETEYGAADDADMKEFKKELSSESTKKIVWEKCKEKDNFKDFITACGYSVDELEIMFSPGECADMYYKYVKSLWT